MNSRSGMAAPTDKSVAPYEFKSIGELYSAPEEKVPFCVEELLPSAGFSILAGKPKGGKSTMARQLAVAVAKGRTFLGREVEQGTVFYLAIEEKQAEVTAHFRQLGVQEGDPLFTICGSVKKNESVARLEAALKINPGTKLVIIDTIFRFVGVKDSNDYIQVNNALEQLQQLARTYGPHILMVHHMKKRETEDPMDGALGSTAIAGAVDTYIALKVNKAGQRTISTRQRYGTDLPETELTWHSETRELSLGQSCEEAERQSAEVTQKRIEREMRSYVSEHLNCTQEAIMNAVRGKKSLKLQVFQAFVDDGTFIRAGEGVKGAPFTYQLARIPTETARVPEVEI
jgi:RecA-family ATPase